MKMEVEPLSGRSLDVKISERVFGRKVCVVPGPEYRPWLTDAEGHLDQPVPLYSFEISAAWEVVEWLKERCPFLDLGWTEGETAWGVHCAHRGGDGDLRTFHAVGTTAPEAICRCALEVAEALSIDEEETTR